MSCSYIRVIFGPSFKRDEKGWLVIVIQAFTGFKDLLFSCHCGFRGVLGAETIFLF